MSDIAKDEHDALREQREWLEGLVTDAGARVTSQTILYRQDEGGPSAGFEIEKTGLHYRIAIKPLS
jgi:hypothetical protein